MNLPPEEEILRAICTDKCDGERIASSAFEGKEVSVSRLAIKPLAEQWEVLRKEVEKPDVRKLVKLAKVSVQNVIDVGLATTPPATLTVEESPTSGNPAHAHVVPKVTRGQSNRLLDCSEILDP
jgi:hypothetical protein